MDSSTWLAIIGGLAIAAVVTFTPEGYLALVW